jgi:hypothetical protein
MDLGKGNLVIEHLKICTKGLGFRILISFQPFSLKNSNSLKKRNHFVTLETHCPKLRNSEFWRLQIGGKRP